MWLATWFTATSGTPSPRASAFAALTPTSRAPTSPGVLWTATHPMSDRATPARARASSTTGSRFRWCARDAISGTTPPNRACRSVCDATTLDSTRRSSVNTAAAVSSHDVSRARKFTGDTV